MVQLSSGSSLQQRKRLNTQYVVLPQVISVLSIDIYFKFAKSLLADFSHFNARDLPNAYVQYKKFIVFVVEMLRHHKDFAARSKEKERLMSEVKSAMTNLELIVLKMDQEEDEQINNRECISLIDAFDGDIEQEENAVGCVVISSLGIDDDLVPSAPPDYYCSSSDTFIPYATDVEIEESAVLNTDYGKDSLKPHDSRAMDALGNTNAEQSINVDMKFDEDVDKIHAFFELDIDRSKNGQPNTLQNPSSPDIDELMIAQNVELEGRDQNKKTHYSCKGQTDDLEQLRIFFGEKITNNTINFDLKINKPGVEISGLIDNPPPYDFTNEENQHVKSVSAKKEFLSTSSGKSINYEDCVRLLAYDGNADNKIEAAGKCSIYGIKEYQSSASGKEIWHQSTPTTVQQRNVGYQDRSNPTVDASR